MPLRGGGGWTATLQEKMKKYERPRAKEHRESVA